MAIIKGENMRVFVEDECVAASTSCNVNVALQVGESDTKDDVEDWMIQEPLGHNWSADVDAMVDLQPDQQGEIVCNGDNTGFGYRGDHTLLMEKGDGIYIVGANPSAEVSILVLTSQGFSQRAHGTGNCHYKATDDLEVYVASTVEGDTLTYQMGDTAGSIYNFLAQVQLGTPVTVKFSKTVAGTHRNRDVETVLLQGDAIVSSVKMNAQVQEITTYQVQLTGTGPLTIVQ